MLSTQSIQLGDTAVGSIDPVEGTDHWLYTLPQGKTVFLDVQSVTGDGIPRVDFELLGPDDVSVVSSLAWPTPDSGDVGPVLLDAPGEYTIVVESRDNVAADYEFVLYDVPAPDVYGLLPGNAEDGEIEVPGASDRWEFDVTAAGSIFLDVQSVGQPSGIAILEFTVVAPDGSEVLRSNASNAYSGPDGGDTGPLPLPTAGTYTLIVEGRGDDTGSYGFQLFSVPETVSRPYELGNYAGATFGASGEVH
jgi:hypothetical protein